MIKEEKLVLHHGESDVKKLLTLIFNHIVPLISDPFALLLRSNRRENKKPLVVRDHVANQRPVLTILWHACQWKPILHQTRVGEDFGQSIRGLNIVLQYNGDYFRWIGR